MRPDQKLCSRSSAACADVLVGCMVGRSRYTITGRKAPGPQRLFITEIFRSKTLFKSDWEPGQGMARTDAVGTPLMAPNATADKAVAPLRWHPDIFDLLSNLVEFWSLGDDCNSTDMVRCDY
jgi:hypothetical protein